MVLHRSIVDWRGGVKPCHEYMCILLYMKLIWCNGFSEIYARLEEGVGSICHGYMCILLYMKLIWCNGFPEIYGQLEEGGMRSVCIGVVVIHRSIVDWRKGVGQSAMGICAFCYIYETYLV